MGQYNDKQERCFDLIDTLIDEGYNVMNLGKELRGDSNYNYHTIRRRFIRNFGSVKECFIAYGLLASNEFLTPSKQELKNCWVVGDGGVYVNDEAYNELLAICNISESQLNRMLSEYKEEALLEYTSKLISESSPEEITNSFFRDKHHNVRHFLTYYIGSISDIRKYFGINESLILYNAKPSHKFIALGYELENLIEKYILPNAETQVSIADSRPDFVSNGVWIDAKLSKSTAVDYRDDTIAKYLRHTDNLTIIYAVDDGANTSYLESKYNVEFKHISEFYEGLHKEAEDELEEFINRATILKGLSI